MKLYTRLIQISLDVFALPFTHASTVCMRFMSMSWVDVKNYLVLNPCSCSTNTDVES